LYLFAANLFRKQCAKSYQNRLNFIEDITKKHFDLSFSGHTVFATYYFNSLADIQSRVCWYRNQRVVVFYDVCELLYVVFYFYRI